LHRHPTKRITETTGDSSGIDHGFPEHKTKQPGADDPAYLAATPEVVLSDAIKAKAAELEHNPVKIFNWVHDHTEWLPTFGAIQNSGC